jgi:hypothetical protein
MEPSSQCAEAEPGFFAGSAAVFRGRPERRHARQETQALTAISVASGAQTWRLRIKARIAKAVAGISTGRRQTVNWPVNTSVREDLSVDLPDSVILGTLTRADRVGS